MAPQLARIADPYGIEVLSSGGFSSLTDTHGLAAQWRRQAITVLQIGDHDPSGVHVFSHLAEDVAAFKAAYQGDVEFIRLAVTLEQAHAFGLASAPPKSTDRRAFDGDETYQAEAIDPADPPRSSKTRLPPGSTGPPTMPCSKPNGMLAPRPWRGSICNDHTEGTAIPMPHAAGLVTQLCDEGLRLTPPQRSA